VDGSSYREAVCPTVSRNGASKYEGYMDGEIEYQLSRIADTLERLTALLTEQAKAVSGEEWSPTSYEYRGPND